MRTFVVYFIVLMFCNLNFVTAQIQLDELEKENSSYDINEEIPVTPNDFIFKKPHTNDQIKYKSKTKYTRTIYVDNENGSDSNNGLSKEMAIKSLEQIVRLNITFGDQILLKGQQIHIGTIELINLNTEKKSNKRIHIGSYGKGKAVIDFRGYPAGVWIQNTSNVSITDLKFTGNGGPNNETFMLRESEKNIDQRYAIRIQSDDSHNFSLMENLFIYNVDIKDVFLLNPVQKSRACRQWHMNDGAGWGWGIFGQVLKNGKGLHNVTIQHVNVSNVSQMGIRFKGAGKIDGSLQGNVNNVKIEYCTIYRSGGPGMQFNRCNNSHMKFCRITESGNRNDKRKWGRGSGMWTWGLHNFLFEHNIFEGAQGIADSCGAHIDFNCRNVVIQNCLSRYNAGGFIEILGLNYNCSYRFNVSINDGWRNIKDPKQKFWGKVGTPGCIVTVNGHNHEKQYKGPYQTYIYNNTIINTIEGNAPYKNPNIFNISTSNEGLVMMNNIFWFEEKANKGWSMHRWKDNAPYDAAFDFKISDAPKNTKSEKGFGDSYPATSRSMNEGELARMELIMRNNIYRLYNADGIDKYSKVNTALADGYWDENARGDNPNFKNETGSEAADFIPTNKKLIYSGEPIPKLSSDSTASGIYFGGLEVTKDFFGNPIKKDIIGAIVPNAKIKDWTKVFQQHDQVKENQLAK
ncbi:right-handed parallel beta-helix repeat-containing protein [Sediminitomix flava]|uniref:Parallel beta helix pectate lyase-like protein n=1 Tax=Sediminitomix flava TaxID=379075 RepID=A0A315Z4J0_SEDFL|nr:right-handed parallel beta-helix repeat-containing protein [Sediminitomix flava]PWJ37938.1 parallel beta helix pectate lyase-like protein [Sediminitomix flava]